MKLRDMLPEIITCVVLFVLYSIGLNTAYQNGRQQGRMDALRGYLIYINAYNKVMEVAELAGTTEYLKANPEALAEKIKERILNQKGS